MREDLKPWHEQDIDDGETRVAPDGIKLVTKFGRDYIAQFQVIVECYDHKKYGRGKREWMKTFTESERKLISSYYGKLYNWFMKRGIPYEGVEMKLSTYNLLCRAADFFASI
jgi:hypothetical protein